MIAHTMYFKRIVDGVVENYFRGFLEVIKGA